MSTSGFRRQESETLSGSTRTTKTTNVLPASNKKVQLTMEAKMIQLGDDNRSYRSSEKKDRKNHNRTYMDDTVASVSRKKTTDELLTKLGEKETFYSGGSVSSWDTRSIRSGASVTSGISRTSKMSMISNSKSIVSNSNASRRLTVSASAYSETRKQKLALAQNMEAATAVAECGSQYESNRSEPHRKRRKKKKEGYLHYRDPDCCVKVAVRVTPERDDIPKCIEVKKIASSWDEDSDIDDNDFVYNGIRIFDLLNEEKKEQEFHFDHVFDQAADNDEVYAFSVAPLVEGTCCQGYNSTILAYGESATGKTFTLFGPKDSKSSNKASSLPTKPQHSLDIPTTVSASYSSIDDVSGDDSDRLASDVGIIPRAMHSVFHLLEGMQQAMAGDTCKLDFSVHVQFLEIGNNEIKDLLATSDDKDNANKKLGSKGNTKIKLRWIGPDPPKIDGAVTKTVTNVSEAWHWLQFGQKHRNTVKTERNTTSSRSHAIFSIIIDQKTMIKIPGSIRVDEVTAQESRSKITFVDLASPQRNMTQESPIHFKEQCDINQSLLTLRLVISALVEQQIQDAHGSREKSPSHKRVPYRDSKLTSVLQASLGGDHKVAMIACLSSAEANIIQSWEVLNYMNKIQLIENRGYSDGRSQSSYSHSKNFDEISAKSSPSCNSTIVTRLTHSSTPKENYEISSRHTILGLGSYGSDVSTGSSNKLTTPTRPSVRQKSGNSTSRIKPRVDISILRKTKGSAPNHSLANLSRDESIDEEIDDWDTTLDDILADNDDVISLDKNLVTPSPSTKSNKNTASTILETPIEDIKGYVVTKLGRNDEISEKYHVPPDDTIGASDEQFIGNALLSSLTAERLDHKFQQLSDEHFSFNTEIEAKKSLTNDESLNQDHSTVQRESHETSSIISSDTIKEIQMNAQASTGDALGFSNFVFDDSDSDCDLVSRSSPVIGDGASNLVLFADDDVEYPILDSDSNEYRKQNSEPIDILDDDERLMRFVGLLTLQKDLDSQNSRELRDAVKVVFENRQNHHSKTNIDNARSNILSAASINDDTRRTVEDLVNHSCDSKEEVELQRLVGYWICHNPSDNETPLRSSGELDIGSRISDKIANNDGYDDLVSSLMASPACPEERISDVKVTDESSRSVDDHRQKNTQTVEYVSSCMPENVSNPHKRDSEQESSEQVEMKDSYNLVALKVNDSVILDSMQEVTEHVETESIKAEACESTNSSVGFETSVCNQRLVSEEIEEPDCNKLSIAEDTGFSCIVNTSDTKAREETTEMSPVAINASAESLQPVSDLAFETLGIASSTEILSELALAEEDALANLRMRQHQENPDTSSTKSNFQIPESTSNIGMRDSDQDCNHQVEMKVCSTLSPSPAKLLDMEDTTQEATTDDEALLIETASSETGSCDTTNSSLRIEDAKCNHILDSEKIAEEIDGNKLSVEDVSSDCETYASDAKVVALANLGIKQHQEHPDISSTKSNFQIPEITSNSVKPDSDRDSNHQVEMKVCSTLSPSPAKLSDMEDTTQEVTTDDEALLIETASSETGLCDITSSSLRIEDAKCGQILDSEKITEEIDGNKLSVDDGSFDCETYASDAKVVALANLGMKQHQEHPDTSSTKSNFQIPEITSNSVKRDSDRDSNHQVEMKVCSTLSPLPAKLSDMEDTTQEVTTDDEALLIETASSETGLCDITSSSLRIEDAKCGQILDSEKIAEEIDGNKLSVDDGSFDCETYASDAKVREEAAMSSLVAIKPSVESLQPVSDVALTLAFTEVTGSISESESSEELMTKQADSSPTKSQFRSDKNSSDEPSRPCDDFSDIVGVSEEYSVASRQSDHPPNLAVLAVDAPGNGETTVKVNKSTENDGLLCLNAFGADKKEDLMASPIQVNDAFEPLQCTRDTAFMDTDPAKTAVATIENPSFNKLVDESLIASSSVVAKGDVLCSILSEQELDEPNVANRACRSDTSASTASESPLDLDQLALQATVIGLCLLAPDRSSEVGILSVGRSDEHPPVKSTVPDTDTKSSNIQDQPLPSSYQESEDPIRRAAAPEKVKVNISVTSDEARNIIPVSNKVLGESGSDLMAEPELDHDCSNVPMLRGSLEDLPNLFRDSSSSSLSDEVDALLNKFDQVLDATEDNAGESFDEERRTLDVIHEKLRLGLDLTETELNLLEIMLEEERRLDGAESENSSLYQVEIQKQSAVRSGASIAQEPMTLRKVKPKMESPLVGSSCVPDLEDSSHSNIDSDAERQRQEDLAESIAMTCCSISCMGRSIEAYYYDYGPAVPDGQNSAIEKPAQKKRRSWISRVMGFAADSPMTKLPPSPVTGMLPVEEK